MITGNKGEWSEYYAFIKLLSDGRLDFGGPGFKKLEDKFYPILKVVRVENGQTKSYELCTGNKVKVTIDEKECLVVDVADLKSKVREIFKVISADSETTFTVKGAEEIMKRFSSTNLNAGNKLKEDIVLKIHDDITGTDPEIGFSIKSMIGGAPTLLNASGPTNFVYKVNGISKSSIESINSIDTRAKIRDRLDAIKKEGGSIAYHTMESKTFEENLRLCDTVMPEILAKMLLLYYSGRGSTFEVLIDNMVLGGIKVAGFRIDRAGYEHKIENLLFAVALGMVPNSRWNGFIRAYGGYIIVRDDGELVGYNVYNADIFRKYLIRNTKFDTASSARHGFGSLYEEKGDVFIKLNLQIRFIE